MMIESNNMLQNQSQEYVQNIIRIAIEGEKSRGDNGAIMIDEETSQIVYLLSHEFQPSDFSEQLNDFLSEDNGVHIFIVHKINNSLHISKIPRFSF